MKIEYTYIIKFIPTGQLYVGSKYGKDANPETFWVEYFTSSNIIKDLIKEHGKDSFEIVEIVPYENGGAYAAETKFLTENDCAGDPNWLNESNNDYCLPHNSDIVKNRMMTKYGVEHNSRVPEIRQRQQTKRLETVMDPDWKEQNRLKYFEKRGVYNSRQLKENQEKVEATVLEKYGVKCVFEAEEIKTQIKATFEEKYGMHPKQTERVKQLCKDNNLKKYGVDSFSKTNEFKVKVAKTWDEKTDEEKLAHKEKSRQIRANDPVFECPHCNKIVKGKTLYNRWHNDNCKLNPKRNYDQTQYN